MNLDPRRSSFGKPRKGQGPLASMRKWIEPALKVSDQPLDPDLERRLRRPMVTGSILIGTVLDELERRDLKRGLVTMCAAGGMAPAIIIERV